MAATGAMAVMLAAAAPGTAPLLTVWRIITSLLGILLLAIVIGRLLGVRRSPGTMLLSGVVGWIAGAVLALVLARNHEHGETGFVRNLWLFGAFFTMSAAVWIEMLAKPGTLARAQNRLASIPRPARAIRRKTQRLGRYAQITRIAARYGLSRSLGMFGTGADDEQGDDLDDREELHDGDGGAVRRAPYPRRLRLALQEAGGMFVKAGQVMSTRADLLPQPVVDELSRLQDNVAPAPRTDVEPMVAEELGRPITEVFEEFDWDPIAAASIGQAYRARLRSGERVVVKVQRPGVAESVERDLDVVRRLAGSLQARGGRAAEYHVDELVQEFAARLREELDFEIEARSTTEMASQLADMPRVRIPKVHGALVTRKVLVIEWFDGVSVRQTERIDALGVDRGELAELLLRCFLQQMLVDGHFHADPHPGNILVLADGSLGLIDFGATGRLDTLQQAAVLQMLVAVSERQPEVLRHAVLDVATVPEGFDDEQFERALARFMARHLGMGATPSAAMFNEMLQLFFGFGIVVPAELSTFFRALIVLDGTITTLAPGFLVIDGAQKLAREWARERVTPATLQQLARDEVVKLMPILRRLPQRVDRLIALAERGDLRARVSLLSAEHDVRIITRLANRAVLALLGAASGLISVLLLGIPGGPELSGQTSLYEFLGYFGLFCSTVLITRVLIAILRDGLS
jgi:ubiquinone biosynthesis protein